MVAKIAQKNGKYRQFNLKLLYGIKGGSRQHNRIYKTKIKSRPELFRMRDAINKACDEKF
jgi:hypothetical protein